MLFGGGAFGVSMPENFALCSRMADGLPRVRMRRLADAAAPELAQTERGATFTYHHLPLAESDNRRWPDARRPTD